MTNGAVAALHRYPVKGLSPERLETARLVAGDYFPGDRLFAIENGASGYDEAAPRHLPKIAFLMLMRNERLARLRTMFDDARNSLVIARDGAVVCEADLGSHGGRETVEAFFARFCAAELRGAPRLRTSAPGFRFTDSKRGFVSILNLASVRALAGVVGRPVDPLRFRANIAVEGWEPWAENDMVGRRLRIGATLLDVLAVIDRCAATEVDPRSGERDMAVVKTLMARFGHNVCGVYASVAEGGPLREGDAVIPA